MEIAVTPGKPNCPYVVTNAALENNLRRGWTGLWYPKLTNSDISLCFLPRRRVADGAAKGLFIHDETNQFFTFKCRHSLKQIRKKESSLRNEKSMSKKETMIVETAYLD